MRRPGIDYARITYRADLMEQLNHGQDQGLDRITGIIMGNRPIYDLRTGGDAGAERNGPSCWPT